MERSVCGCGWVGSARSETRRRGETGGRTIRRRDSDCSFVQTLSCLSFCHASLYSPTPPAALRDRMSTAVMPAFAWTGSGGGGPALFELTEVAPFRATDDFVTEPLAPPALFRCLDATHGPGCVVCVDAPSTERASRYILVGEAGQASVWDRAAFGRPTYASRALAEERCIARSCAAVSHARVGERSCKGRRRAGPLLFRTQAGGCAARPSSGQTEQTVAAGAAASLAPAQRPLDRKSVV